MSDEETAPYRPRPWALIALGILLVGGTAFAIGRFSTFGGAEPGPNAADVGFARDMQVHHAQAVEMAMIEYRATSDEELRLISYDIATAQAQQSGQMFGWIVNWGLPQRGSDPLMAWMAEDGGHDHGGSTGEPASEDELRAEMGMASDAELDELRAATGAEQDCLFTELMIRHHTGAIEMVDAIQRLGGDPIVLRTAEGMAESQEREIQALESVRARLACD
ncbi:DUF305 domain-containing protein [Microbacterium sp. MEC084]|uniref:DUF305 domain-containing protein n=1 Tax=Microbacterium sp. MEC084 TaxID=1963027 RepID=UPI00106F24A5|nr:DUF305 domain-containing protein [Microbacterium sp. MEC084]MCD1268433.1 DUF305 domain-containing protein [Microbacterium sp. MEC084]